MRSYEYDDFGNSWIVETEDDEEECWIWKTIEAIIEEVRSWF